ncbi:MAG TPA: hypothetical protein VE621_08955 [Bryobacteraceae bacterium]|nr:hypothetical protein [Bryobacteraceae bacterium]
MASRSRQLDPFSLDRLEVQHQLERILESPHFRNSKRCSAFLKHVVESTFEGRTTDLKERTLGVAVFEREPDYDTNKDPIVRNTAGQVRKRLAQYYYEPEHESELRIELPAGSYVPEIAKVHEPPPVESPVAPVPEPAPATIPAPQPPRTRPLWLFAGIGLAAAIAVVLWMTRGSSTVQRFWQPLLNSPGPVVVCVGQGHPYRLPEEVDRHFENPGSVPAMTSIPLSAVTPAWDRYIAFADSQVLMRLAVLFTRFDKPVELRGGRQTSLADLRRRPVVLVGAFNNEWTLRLTGELRFYFETDQAGKVETLRDRQNPNNRTWQVPISAAISDMHTDYAIVSRVFNPTTEQTVVVAAGIRGGGTTAAGEFLTNPQYLEQALQKAPRDWQKKNMQFVISTRMFSGNPGPPTLLAAHFW